MAKWSEKPMRKGRIMKFDKENAKRKMESLKVEAANRFRTVSEWCANNTDLLVVLVPAGISLATGAMKMHGKHVQRKNLKKEQDLKELYIYDRSLGMYHKLNKPLTSNQAIEIERRRENGERMASVLRDMRLI